jgi:hypothetical protein
MSAQGGTCGSIVILRMAGIGASCPFRLVLANVPSPNPQQPFAADDNLLSQACRPGIVAPGRLS